MSNRNRVHKKICACYVTKKNRAGGIYKIARVVTNKKSRTAVKNRENLLALAAP